MAARAAACLLVATAASVHAAPPAIEFANVVGVGEVPVESDYIPHVVACENGAAAFEALKVQAVAARSYLYFKMQTAGSINDGTSDQVYTCARPPRAEHFRAVQETEHEILSFRDVTVAAFYVAGAFTTYADGDLTPGADPTNTERFVTYNQGLSGNSIHQTPLGFVHPSNLRNRGAMSQNGSNTLAQNGWTHDEILPFYYGADIVREQALVQLPPLRLSVDLHTGEAVMSNPWPTPITIDAYSLASASASLDPARWLSLSDRRLRGWQEDGPTPAQLSELNVTSFLRLDPDESFSLGVPFAASALRDLTFSYQLKDREMVQGEVEFVGELNGLTLFIDAVTGDALLRNDSPFDISIDGYSILSPSGSLDPAGWVSFEDSGFGGGTWQEANPTFHQLNELNPGDATTLLGFSTVSLGRPFRAGEGVHDLRFEFQAADGAMLTGAVEYSALAPLVGDTNGDGLVDLADLNNVRNNFGAAGLAVLGDTNGDELVDLADLNNVRNNFGAARAAAVPEPSAFVLALAGVFAASALMRRSRRVKS